MAIRVESLWSLAGGYAGALPAEVSLDEGAPLPPALARAQALAEAMGWGWVQGSGFRVQGSRFRVQGSGFRV